MNEKEKKEIAKEMAEIYGISLDSASSTIVSIERAIPILIKGIIEVGRLLADFVVTIWEEIKYCIERLERETRERQVWLTDWDTRKKSQVISNKPRFMVRKIIG